MCHNHSQDSRRNDRLELLHTDLDAEVDKDGGQLEERSDNDAAFVATEHLLAEGAVQGVDGIAHGVGGGQDEGGPVQESNVRGQAGVEEPSRGDHWDQDYLNAPE